MQMLKNLFFVLLAFISFNCSSSKLLQQEPKKNDTGESKTQKIKIDENKSLEYFIDGATADAKKEYDKAIQYYILAEQIAKDKGGIYYAIAKDYYRLGKIPPALHTLKKAIKLEPKNLSYKDLLSSIYSSASQIDSATAVLNDMIAIDSTMLNYYYKLARLYENSQPSRAIKIYNKLTDKIGMDWNVLVRVAELYEKLDNYDKASKTLYQLLNIDPNNAQIQKLLVQIFIRQKKYDDAIKTINSVLELIPDDIEAHQMKAQIYIEDNKWKKASKEFEFILSRPSISLESKINTASTYFNKALKDSTLMPFADKLFSIIDKDTLDWQVKLYKGAIDVSLDRDSLAAKEFQQVTKLAKWNPDGWIRLGGLYFDHRKYNEAIKLMNQAVKQFPENFTINLIMGLSLAQTNKNEEAKLYLDRSVQLKPSDINALSGYAFTLRQLGENDKAVFYLKKALFIVPGDVNLLGTLGLIYNEQNKMFLSDSIYESALKIDSTNALVNNNYAYSLSERGIKLNRALKMVKIALAADSLNSSYLDTIGWVYFKLKKYNIAKKYIKQALKEGGESATMLDHLGDIEYYLHNKKRARKLWKKALKLDPKNEKLEKKIEKGEI
ncbi:MAG TPA: tetratricopeptide repeat protein [Ignavibacteria bacterium]|nr:tetratricopeptide repeat protein [Ignavibacteria bacterium]